ncbi:MAG: hypothetical protein ACK4TD_00620 [Ectopseudomonas guguanensis]|uniref:hypothetical protein n=1 Tax=Ectopseudomonas guguanensis TaxID=1198456 RepID=UPI00391B76D8
MKAEIAKELEAIEAQAAANEALMNELQERANAIPSTLDAMLPPAAAALWIAIDALATEIKKARQTIAEALNEELQTCSHGGDI